MLSNIHVLPIIPLYGKIENDVFKVVNTHLDHTKYRKWRHWLENSLRRRPCCVKHPKHHVSRPVNLLHTERMHLFSANITFLHHLFREELILPKATTFKWSLAHRTG